MSILDSGRTARLPGMSLVTTLLLLISLCYYYDYYYSNEQSPPFVPRAVKAATPPPPVTPFVRARKEASSPVSPLESDDDFPAIYDMTVPKSELTHNPLVREWIANLDLLTMKCDDAESSSGGTTTTSRHHDRHNAAVPMTTCRLTMLVHSENEYHSLLLGWGQQSHHQHVFHGIQRNQEATLGLWHNRQKKSLKDHDQLLPQSNPDRPPIMDATRVDDPATDESTVTTTRRLTGDYSRISGFPCMFNYEGTMQWIQDLVDEQEQQEQQGNTSTSLRSDVTLTWTDIGDSYLKTKNSTKGHDIRVLKISGITANNNRNGSSTFEKAPFLILTGVHPREYAPPELVRRWIHWLVTTKTDVKARLLLETTDVYWIPYVNPDGRVLAETSEIYRRKNVNRESSGQQTCQESEYGVDLNRNFPFRYGRDDGSSSSPCSEVFRGSGPASEPEVQAVIRLGDTIFPKSQRMETIDQTYLDQGLPQAYNETTTRGVFLDIHSFGNTYIYPWGFENTPSPNHDQLTALVHKLRHFSGYAITGPGPEFTYGASGATDDWAYATLGAASMTWEIGTFFHEDCSNFLGNVVPDNMDALTYAGMLAHLPYRFSQGPDIVHLALDSSVLEEGQSLTLSVEASDGAFSNSTLIEEASQQVMMILFFLDVNPYSMLQEDEWVLAANWLMAEDDLNENGKANWTVEWSDVQEILGNQTGSLEDQHLIYAMAIDQDGYPGVLSAVEFFFECSNCTMAPTSMTSDPPSMFPSSLPPTKMLGTSTPSVPKAETNPESLLEEGVTIAEVTDQSSAMASPLGSWRMIGLESSLTLLALFTMW